jgi:hypothetical protein
MNPKTAENSRLILLLVLVMSSLCGARSPLPPDLGGPTTGPQLVALARAAMTRYLRDRSGPTVAPSLRSTPVAFDGRTRPLGEVPLPVAVILRRDGKPIGRSIVDSDDVLTNTIRAAQSAMRDPRLGDRITPERLAALRVEVAVLGPDQPIAGPRVRDVLTAGLDGLALRVGRADPSLPAAGRLQSFYEKRVLPSEAYLDGLGATRMGQRCKQPLSPNLPGKRHWAIFATQHAVSYPADGGTWLLYRGKLLQPPMADMSAARLRVARTVANFLIRHRADDGQLELPKWPASLWQQLRAAEALARLARHVERDDAESARVYRSLAQGVLGAIAQQHIRPATDDRPARLVTGQTRADLVAAAGLIRSARLLPSDDYGRRVTGQLTTALRRRFDTQGRLVDTDGSPLGAGSDLTAILLESLIDDAQAADLRRKGAEELLYRAGLLGATSRPAEPLGGASLARLGRVILAGHNNDRPQDLRLLRPLLRDLLDRRMGPNGPADAVGGIIDTGRIPTTAATAATIRLARELLALQGPPARAALGDIDPAELNALIAGGLNFIHQMTYRRPEAWFWRDPKAFDGAVRIRPGSAEISLSACADAIEAMIGNP